MGAIKEASLEDAERLYAMFTDHFQITGNACDRVPLDLVLAWMRLQAPVDSAGIGEGHLTFMTFLDFIRDDGVEKHVDEDGTTYLRGVMVKTQEPTT